MISSFLLTENEALRAFAYNRVLKQRNLTLKCNHFSTFSFQSIKIESKKIF